MFRLCLVTAVGDCPLDRYVGFLRAAVAGGVDCVEWREKLQPMARLADVKVIQQALTVPLLINDYPAIASDIGAAGVHLGNSDMAVDEARALIGPSKIIGLSVESEEDLVRAQQQEAVNYVTASAVFASQHKSDTKKIWGLTGLRRLVEQNNHAPQKKPMTAIGGITLDNVAAVMKTGVMGVAVIGALHELLADETAVYQRAKDFRSVIDSIILSHI